MKFFLLLTLFSSGAIAEVTLDNIVDEFFLRHQLESIVSDKHDDCKRNPQMCADAACKKLGSFGCDSDDKIKTLLSACSRNYNSQCLDYSCKLLGAFGCDSIEEVKDIAKSCSYLPDSKCTQFVCSKLNPFDCNEVHEIVAINQKCAGR
jgi:hypothetical protein